MLLITGVDVTGKSYTLCKKMTITGLGAETDDPIELPKKKNQKQPYEEPLADEAPESI